MANEQWLEYPSRNDSVSKTVFFDELKTNLVAVIKDYAGLGIENESTLIALTNKLFRGTIVPSRADFSQLQAILVELAKIKEFNDIFYPVVGSVEDSLGASDLQNIRDFLDKIQETPPQAAGISISLPAPNVRYMNIPTVTSSNSFKTSMVVNWAINAASLAIKKATITGTASRSEDIKEYQLTIKAGAGSWSKTFGPKEAITYSIDLNWHNWFTVSQIKAGAVQMQATLIAIDKRGNRRISTTTAKYPANTVIPTPIQSYEIQYTLNGGAYTTIGKVNTSNTSGSFTWSNIPKVDGRYRFRIYGKDTAGNGIGGFTFPNSWWSYAYSNWLDLVYTPPAPDKPNVKATTTWNSATVTWQACARATHYIVWNGDETWAKNNTTGGRVYWKRVEANQARSVVIQTLRENATHGIKVRAEGAGGSATGSVVATTKKRVLKKKTYNSVRTRVWRGLYDQLNWRGRILGRINANWRTEKNTMYQGEWKEPNDGWRTNRGGQGAYYSAYGGQAWGNHMSFIYFQYGTIRKDLVGKEIKKVTMTFKRENTGAHGFPSAKPIYVYNHNRDDSSSTTTPNAFTLFRPDNRAAVTNKNPLSLANVQFNRGKTESISNTRTKQLLQNIVNGQMRGLGIVKYYGSAFNSKATYSDTAYMRLSNNVKIEVEYYDA